MRRIAPPERETLDRLPQALDGRPWDLPFPPGSWVLTTWRNVGGRLHIDGTIEGGEWCVASQRAAEEADIEGHKSKWRELTTMRPYEEATPTTEAVMGALAQLAEVDQAHRPPPPTAEERRADTQRQRLWQAGRAGVPAGIVGHLRQPEDRPALVAVRAWARGDRLALLLHGANQAGKSLAAAAWLSTHERGRWAGADEIGLATQPDPQHRGTAWLRELRGAGALVIDNIGARCGPAGYEEIEALIMHHLAAGRRLIVTTDYDPDRFFALFGDERRNRVLSRWRLVGSATSVAPWAEQHPGGAL